MRQPARGQKPRKAKPVSFPAPTAGWIANRALAVGRDPKLPPGAAVLDNWFPTSTGITLRRGRDFRYSIGSAPVLSMFNYLNGNDAKLFSSINGPIYDISSDPAVLVRPGGTNGDWRVAQFSTAGGTFLIGVNGTDTAWLYNGSTFAATTITFPGGSPLTTANLSYVWSYGKRLWFIEKDTLNVWYLPVDSIGGALTLLPLGGIFTLGGALVWGSPWSLSSGGQGGLSEQIVFTTSEGEVLAYQGTDPADANNFARVGLYRIGEPMGAKGFVRAGGDLLIATSVGMVSLASAAAKDFAALGAAASSYPIEEAWTAAVMQRGMLDWRCLVWPEGKMLLVSPPSPAEAAPDAFVANVNLGSWCRFTNWDITSMAVHNGQLHMGTSTGQIWLGNVTGQDGDTPYTGVCIPLFEDMGAPANRKIAKNGRVIKRSKYSTKEKLTASFNFNMTPPPAPNAVIDDAGGLWGTGIWGESIWGTDAGSIVTTDWRSLGGSGQDMSVCLQITSGAIYPLDVEIVRIDATIDVCEVIS